MFSLFKNKVKIDNKEITLKEFADMRRNIYLGCYYDRQDIIKYIYQCIKNKLVENNDRQTKLIKRYFTQDEDKFNYRTEININEISDKFIGFTYKEIEMFIKEETTFEDKVKDIIITHIGKYALNVLTDYTEFTIFIDKVNNKLSTVLTLKFIYNKKSYMIK